MKRTFHIIAGLVALSLAVAAPAAVAKPSEPAATRTIVIDANFDDQGGLMMPHTCSADTPGLCQLTFSSAPEWTGTFVGTSINRAYGSFNPLTQELDAVVWEYFPEVTVVGCGSGTMMWRGEIKMTPEQQDPTTGGIVMSGTWKYVEGSGTGGLANIESGIFTAEDVVFKPPFMENHDKAKGSLVCHAPSDR